MSPIRPEFTAGRWSGGEAGEGVGLEPSTPRPSRPSWPPSFFLFFFVGGGRPCRPCRACWSPAWRRQRARATRVMKDERTGQSRGCVESRELHPAGSVSGERACPAGGGQAGRERRRDSTAFSPTRLRRTRGVVRSEAGASRTSEHPARLFRPVDKRYLDRIPATSPALLSGSRWKARNASRSADSRSERSSVGGYLGNPALSLARPDQRRKRSTSFSGSSRSGLRG